jgi:hypothetical protein
MKIATGFTLCVLCVFAAGCASFTGQRERSPEADKITVYEGVPPGHRPYRLVKRVWAQPWRSAFDVPKYGSDADGAADLQNQAVALSGDAVMNFGCYRLRPEIPVESHPDLICNGNVIKYAQ